MKIVSTNYSDDSIALLAYLAQAAETAITVVSIDTGFAAPSWAARVSAAERYARACGFAVVRLQAKQSFGELVQSRQAFPNKKFQWCAGLLKGMTLLTWLDEIDLACTATILLAKRRATSRASAELPAVITASEHYGERRVEHPILMLTDEACQSLVQTTGLPWLGHRSLECDPCIHSLTNDFARLEPATVQRAAALEASLEQPMFNPAQYQGAAGIEEIVKAVHNGELGCQTAQQRYDVFDMGCGSPFACGV